MGTTTPLEAAEDHPRLISTTTAARRLAISPTALRALIGAGEIRAHRIARVFRVDEASLEEYLERSRIRPTP